MDSKYLFIQIDIGQGTQWGNDKTINPIRIFDSICAGYCKKNYDYRLIKKAYKKK